jgi:ribose transport system substrate-binding protein
MKKYNFKMTIIACFLLFQGCNSQKEKHYTFLFLTRPLVSDFHSLVVKGAKHASDDKGITLRISQPNIDYDFDYQIKEIKKVIKERNINGVIVTPNHSSHLLNTLEELDRYEIPFIVVDTPLDLKNTQYSFRYYCGYVGTDNQYGGMLAAQFITHTMNQGKILMIRGINDHQSSKDREIGFLNHIKKQPHFKIIKFIDGRWDEAITKNILSKLPSYLLNNLDAIFAYNDEMALGAADFYSTRKPRPLIIGYDGLVEVQKKILEEKIDATIAQVPDIMGETAVKRLVDCIEKENYDQTTILTHVTLIKLTKTLTYISKLD